MKNIGRGQYYENAYLSPVSWRKLHLERGKLTTIKNINIILDPSMMI